MFKKFSGLLAALAVSALALSGCTSGASPTNSTDSSSPTITGGPLTPDVAVTIGLTYIPNIQFAPFYVAKEKKLFDLAGSKAPVNLRHHGADEGLFNALLSGKENFVVAFGDEAVQAASQGMELTTVGILYQRYPVVVIAKADSGIKTWQDLKGKTVGLPGRYGSNWFGFQAGLNAAGLTLDDVKVSEIGYTQQTQLTTGKVDAVVGFSNNDLVRFNLAGVKVTTLALPENTPLVGAAIVTTEDYAKSNPEICQGVVDGMAEAVNLINENPELALTETRKYDETLTNEASLEAAKQVLAATNELTKIPNYDPENPGKASLPNPKQFRDMIALLDKIGALSDQVDLTKLDDAGLAKIVWSGSKR